MIPKVQAATAQGDRDEQEDRYLLAATHCCACGAAYEPKAGGSPVRCEWCVQHNKPAGDHRAPALLVAVADGMGGHENGAEAAEKAVAVLARILPQRIARGADPFAALAVAFLATHRAVQKLGECSVTGTREHKFSCHCRTPGTTLTALWLHEGRAFIGHVGDSRCYRVEAGALVQVTTDHLVWGGLSQAIGCPGDIDPQIVEVPAKGRYLICSDGLTGVLKDEEIAALPWDADAIVKAAIEAGKAKDAAWAQEGRSWTQDNTTVVLIDLGEGGDVG